MKAKCRKGCNLLFTTDCSSKWDKINDYIVINFNDRWIYQSFKQKKNHLYIQTQKGEIDIVFTGIPPKLSFESYVKDQLILSVINEKSN